MPPARIDEINILQATYEAMREAISKLSVKPDVLLNDAVKIPQVDIRQVPIIKGDAKSVSIAAASIVAKVTRDRLMEEYDKVLPGYGFASNKGYGSAEHIAALKEIGPSPSTGSRLSAISCKGTASKKGEGIAFESAGSRNETGEPCGRISGKPGISHPGAEFPVPLR